ncbi:hypothetical protein BN7_245 [Wickerhamomyces ciferrii]|uniref:Uncharacterized protein n=1 Tax=Wickerhamomyces ciferrii (strain ATCC 14091 / BCRC 22168 / CBS 111 / JCM 3599 / NBRC 0793 / NRRL Y-1031 F-60-10) TaxID=1206466 RepID=K0KCU4_WICCF|nr:uncharacterized protein BN7_245 [Wickerhamomyces ciferrii]CCH40711.1 hypothetical protein BN7_245 [Wickerhamomyces ciferrii]
MYRPIGNSLVIGTRRSTTGLISTRTSIISSYQFSTTTKTQKEESKSKSKSKKSTGPADKNNIFDPRVIGLTSDQYIPISWRNIPNPLSSPRLAWNVVLRKIYTVGINTIQVALLRYQTGLKPKFLLWKNNAIENYVQVNKSFASKTVKDVHSSVSMWVEESLKNRSASIPNNIRLSWKLVKFNETPKLITFRPLMMPGRPVEHVQIVYRFNTKQQLVKVNLDNNKTDKITRDVTDHVGFLIDLHTNETILCGSVFENAPTDKIPKPEDIDRSVIIKEMRERGDIFRSPPPSIADNSKITKDE